MKRFFLFCMILGIGLSVFADELPDTTIFLNEVSINSNVVQNFSSGNKIQSLSNKTIQSYKTSNLTTVLSENSMVNIKSYGISGISNISIRGSLSNQTAILWNGISLQDPLNGSSNPSLIPVGLVDEIEIQYGGSGALYGSGAVGGVIMMNKKMEYNTGWGANVLFGVGSFSHVHGQVQLRYGGAKYSGSLIYYHSQAQNDFNYINNQVFGHPEVKQENAATNVDGLSQDNSFILNENQKINTHLWYQKSHREIAPNMTISDAQQFQDDEAFRFSSDWIKYGEKISLMSRIGVVHSVLDYNDPGIDLTALHQSTSIISQFESNIQINDNQLFNYGFNNQFDMGKSDNFPENTHRNTAAIFLSYKLQLFKRKVQLTTSVREELINDQFGTPTPSLGVDWNIKNYLSIKAKISRNYRTPTFNDLYWQGGFAIGNMDLKPESGWSEEIGFVLNQEFDSYQPSIQITAFNSRINDLIIWLPKEELWSPVNKKKVWSRGLEFEQRNDINWSHINTGLNLYYTYNPSTLETSDNSGNHLIYQPINQAKAKYYFKYKSYTLNIIYQWFDERFITEDNTKSLTSYQILNLGFNTDFSIKKHVLTFHFRLNNIFNEVYQSVNNYAMPGRNFEISIQYKIN